MKHLLHSIKRGLINLYVWFPIIWKDRNWDHSFILDIIKFKLKQQSLYIGNENRHTRAKKDARDMIICVNLIEKINDGFYESEYFDFYKDDMWTEELADKPGYYEMKFNPVWEKFDDYFKLYPLIYNKVLKDGGIFSNDTKHHIAMNIGHINQQRAQDLLFKIMNENINGWWN
jgi:hypothetical protein